MNEKEAAHGAGAKELGVEHRYSFGILSYAYGRPKYGLFHISSSILIFLA